MKAKLDENSRCGSQLVSGSSDTMFTRPSKKISQVATIPLHSPSRLRLVERLEEVFQGEAVSEWAGCFVVVTDQKIRVRRTPNQRS